MRNNKDKDHTEHDSVLDVLSECFLLHVGLSEYDEADDVERNGLTDSPYPARRGEFQVWNKWCEDDPMYLTKEEILKWAAELAELANAELEPEGE